MAVRGGPVLVATVVAVTLAAPGASLADHRLRRTGRLCAGRPDAVSLRGSRLSGNRQRWLSQCAHRRFAGVRRGEQPLPTRHPRGAHRSGHPVPDGVQPGFRAPLCRRVGRSGSGRPIDHRQRSPGGLPLRPADLSRRSERAGRSGSASSPSRADQSGRRPAQQPASARVLAGTDGQDGDRQNGTACPANKLLITPARPLSRGSSFTVTVAYTGRPGVHLDGDGSTEGWFRSNSPVGDGGFVTTEPVGTEDWMPLNDHPSAKPTYDLYATVNAGKTAIGNGVLVSRQAHPANSTFPHGSTTWHWRSQAPVASYLVEASVGSLR